MTPKRQRMMFVLGGLCFMGIAAAITLRAFDDHLVFFYTPTELMTKEVSATRTVRIGGLVKPGSLSHEGKQVRFLTTDQEHDLPVVYQGILPDLFREGQGVVAEGKMGADRRFHAERIFAKHDENYMPAEVSDALKKSGHWKDDYNKGAK